MTSETEEGQRLATGKLKRITQGMGRIKATRKYENPIEFAETHKLFIDANHLPRVHERDDAIWNRMHPIPFNVQFSKDRQDPQLQGKLLAEAEGILAWAVRGAVEWYRNGLGKPPTVEQAATAWRAESDQIGRFLADSEFLAANRHRFMDGGTIKASSLYELYHHWCENNGERFMSSANFGKRVVEQAGVERHTTRGGECL
jgi:putative DNA primase/helicase